ncbi:MAG: nickel pincer cofactor biosynthesis protein LarC [Methanomicrobium sp.]|nr:nickel pincer cofactor biosynthesis protein LarC [Methanomicrobium sp.]MDD4299052.1 nickel pincer cofactor biosynthesis protein LarC [Methanomicrobium sp.]
MRILLFDPFHGAAGDMITASLLSLGADKKSVTDAMSSVVAEPDISTVDRCGISALKIKTNAEKTHRTLGEVLEIVNKSNCPKDAMDMAVRVFERIARGEERIHGKMPHFHEVGADDAIADVIGACTAFLSLKPDLVYIKPVNLGSGFVISEHGRMPVPAPATLEILKESGLDVISGSDINDGELCTPTGAALLSEFYSGNKSCPQGKIMATGYGAGTKDSKNTPNVLRTAIIEETKDSDETVDILETNVDDVTGEVLAYTMQRIMDEGARDISSIPVIMKKGRHGFLIRVICSQNDSDKYVKILSEELGTLGVRHIKAVHRSVIKRSLERTEISIDGKKYDINVKTGWIDNMPSGFKAEFEDTGKCAKKTGLPIKKIAKMAEDAAAEKINKKSGKQ